MSLVAALAVGAALVPASVASAAPKPSAQILGTVQMAPGGETATVTARYTCFERTHLWVSAKQMADGRRDAALMEEGSSRHADAYLQQHPRTLDCDGRNHVQSFTIDKTEVTPWGRAGHGALRKGQAWVQFCLYTEAGAISESRWSEVR